MDTPGVRIPVELSRLRVDDAKLAKLVVRRSSGRRQPSFAIAPVAAR